MVWCHTHSTYVQKSSKLDLPLLPCTQSYAFGLTHFCACVLSIYSPPPNKFLLRFKFSSLRISRLFSFLVVSEVKFHKTNIKKISMVSIYRLRPVHTFLYTIISGNVIVSFVQKKKSFEILWSKKIFGGGRGGTYATLKPPISLVCNRTHVV